MIVPVIAVAVFNLFAPSEVLGQIRGPAVEGWEALPQERKDAYLALVDVFESTKKAWSLSPEEKGKMSSAELKAHFQAVWEIKTQFVSGAAAAGFVFAKPEAKAIRAEVLATMAEMPSAEGENLIEESPQEAVGSIVYDSGPVTTSFGGGSIIGNRFNTALGQPVLPNGTIETVSAVVIPGPSQTTSSAGFVIEGPKTAGGGAQALFSSFTNAAGTVDTVVFNNLGVQYTGNSFYVLFGDFANSYVPAFGPGTLDGQGHHGVRGFTGGMGPNITSTAPISGLNAFIRATGNITNPIPVELMKFEIKSESR